MYKLIPIIVLAAVLTLTACGAPQQPISSAAPSSAPSATAVVPSASPSVTVVPTTAATSSATAAPPTVTAPPTTSPPTATATAAASATAAAAASPTASATATTPATATATQAAAPPTASPQPTSASGGGAVRPDLQGTIAFERGGNIYAYRPQTGAVTLLIEDGRDVQFSHDGAQLAFVRDDGLYLAAADGSASRRIVAQPAIAAPRWADDDSKLAFVRARNPSVRSQAEVWTIELAQGGPVKIANGDDPAWAPDSKRLAYVTTYPESDPTERRRNELHLSNWRGQNDWAVVRGVPANTPPTGIPGGEIPPAQLEHLLFAPVWSADGGAIYVLAQAAMQVETDFVLFERADATNGGATYLETLMDVRGALASPDRRAVLFITASARGDISLRARPLDPTLGVNAYAWANATSPQQTTYQFLAPSWAPSSDALATIRCAELGIQQQRCDLVLLAPGQSEPAVLIADVFQGVPFDYLALPTMSWGR